MVDKKHDLKIEITTEAFPRCSEQDVEDEQNEKVHKYNLFLNAQDLCGNTALHMAVLHEKYEAIDWLIQNGARYANVATANTVDTHSATFVLFLISLCLHNCTISDLSQICTIIISDPRLCYF